MARLSTSDASFYQLENTRHPALCGLTVDPASAARRAELRNVAGHRRTAAAEGTAVPAEGPGSGDEVGPAGVDRRPRFRHHLPRPALGAAVAGQRRAVARTDRPAGGTAAGQVPAALGDVLGGGLGQKSPRPVHQVAPGVDQRHGSGGHRSRHRRPEPASAAVRRGHLGTGPRTRYHPAVVGRPR